MRDSTCIFVLLALCIANAPVISGALLPDLDSGVAIDENNMVNLIQVEESLEGRRGPAESHPGESDDDLFKEGTEVLYINNHSNAA